MPRDWVQSVKYVHVFIAFSEEIIRSFYQTLKEMCNLSRVKNTEDMGELAIFISQPRDLSLKP